MHDARKLVVGCFAERAEVFIANRRLQREPVVNVGLEVDIHGGAVLVGGRVIREPAEAVRAGREALVGERPEGPRRLVACIQVELLLAILRAEGHVQIRSHTGVDTINKGRVNDGFGLLLPAWNEVSRRVRTERGVDRVSDEEVRPVRTVVDAEVIAEAVTHADLAANTEGNGHILVVAAEARHEARRDRLEEGEAVGIGRDIVQKRLIRNQVIGGDAVYAGTADSDAIEVANEYRYDAVGIFQTGRRIDERSAVNTAALAAGCCGERRAIEEAACCRALSIVTESINFGIFAQFESRVEEELDVVLDIGLTPVVRHFARIRVDGLEVLCRRIAGVDHGLDVVTNDRPNRAFHVVEFCGQVQEPGLADREADIACNTVVAAVALECRSVIDVNLRALRLVSEHEVDNAGNGVRTVLRGCAVTQNLDLLEGEGRNRGNIDALRTVGDTAAQE